VPLLAPNPGDAWSLLCRVKSVWGRLFTRGAISLYALRRICHGGERSSWGGRDYHNGSNYFPLEQCLPWRIFYERDTILWHRPPCTCSGYTHRVDVAIEWCCCSVVVDCSINAGGVSSRSSIQWCTMACVCITDLPTCLPSDGSVPAAPAVSVPSHSSSSSSSSLSSFILLIRYNINFLTWQYMSRTDKAIKLLQLPYKQNINQEKRYTVSCIAFIDFVTCPWSLLTAG